MFLLNVGNGIYGNGKYRLANPDAAGQGREIELTADRVAPVNGGPHSIPHRGLPKGNRLADPGGRLPGSPAPRRRGPAGGEPKTGHRPGAGRCTHRNHAHGIKPGRRPPAAGNDSAGSFRFHGNRFGSGPPSILLDKRATVFTPVPDRAAPVFLNGIEAVSLDTLGLEALGAVVRLQLPGRDGQMAVPASKPGFRRSQQHQPAVITIAHCGAFPSYYGLTGGFCRRDAL